MYRYSLAFFALALTAPAMAEQPSYNFLQAAYQRVEIDLGGILGDVDGDGYQVGGSFEIGESMYFFADYADAGLDFNVDSSQIKAGFGFHHGISANTDFFANLAYVKAELELGGIGSADENGYGVAIGVRSNVSDTVELELSVSYVDLGDDIDSTSVDGRFWFDVTDTFALGLGAGVDDDVTTYEAGMRWYFDY